MGDARPLRLLARDPAVAGCAAGREWRHLHDMRMRRLPVDAGMNSVPKRA
jgi:hypothetical protein